MSQDMYDLLQHRDAELAALRRYVRAVEEKLVERRVEEAESEARQRSWDDEIRLLRFDHGFKSDGRWRG